jgi:hypothetical protein
LEAGLLHSLNGFGEGLLASDVQRPLRHVREMRAGVSDRFHTYLDGNDRAVTRTYRCVFERRDVQDISLLDRTARARLMIERCRNLDQEFENLYWVDPRSGRVLLSRQWAGPYLGAVSTRVVPGGAS